MADTQLDSPQVSILVCVYNGAGFLKATLDSACAQTYTDFELIAVDDGSTDQSAALIEHYAAQHHEHRIRLIRQANAGAASALSIALAAARGTYIALLDQDDLWHPESLASHVAALSQNPHVDLTFSWFRIIDDRGNEIGLHSNRFRGTIDFSSLLTDFVIGASSNVVLRRETLLAAGGVDVALRRLYDLDLCLRVALQRPHNVMAIPRDLMFYRRHPVQITRDLRPLEQEWTSVVQKYERLAPRPFQQVGALANANMLRYFACLAYEDGNYRGAIARLRRGLGYAPVHAFFDRRNWLTLLASISGVCLPGSLHRGLEQLAGLKRPKPQ